MSARGASDPAGVAFGFAQNIPMASVILLINPVCVYSNLLLSSLLIRTPRNPATSSSTVKSISNSLNLAKVLSISVVEQSVIHID